ncbi:MAG: hypothetical protein AB1941_21465 [Gemmatimonadota bacterium]
MLLFLTLVLVGPYVLLTAADRWLPGVRIRPVTRGKVGLSLFFLVTSSAHFTSTAAMAEMLPPFVPFRTEIVLATGVLEILGALGVWVPRLARLTGLCLILMLIGILPSNVYAALARVPFGGHEHGPVYLWVRVPFQFLVIAWVYGATGQRWLRRSTPGPAKAATDAP